MQWCSGRSFSPAAEPSCPGPYTNHASLWCLQSGCFQLHLRKSWEESCSASDVPIGGTAFLSFTCSTSTPHFGNWMQIFAPIHPQKHLFNSDVWWWGSQIGFQFISNVVWWGWGQVNWQQTGKTTLYDKNSLFQKILHQYTDDCIRSVSCQRRFQWRFSSWSIRGLQCFYSTV